MLDAVKLEEERVQNQTANIKLSFLFVIMRLVIQDALSLFKSFTGLSIPQFDGVCKEIGSKCFVA